MGIFPGSQALLIPRAWSTVLASWPLSPNSGQAQDLQLQYFRDPLYMILHFGLHEIWRTFDLDPKRRWSLYKGRRAAVCNDICHNYPPLNNLSNGSEFTLYYLDLSTNSGVTDIIKGINIISMILLYDFLYFSKKYMFSKVFWMITPELRCYFTVSDSA